MKCKRLFLVLLFVFCCVAATAQGELTTQYLSIRDKLTNLKTSSEVVTEQLKLVSDNLKVSQVEVQIWEQTSTQLSENLMSINGQLNECYEAIEKQRAKNLMLTKLLLTLSIVFAILIAVKVIFIVLYAKGLPMARIIDIIV